MSEIFPSSLRPRLGMPLRDLLRGVASVADAANDFLTPATRLLPAPLRGQMDSAIDRLRSAGRYLAETPVTMDQISIAAGVVAGRAPGGRSASTCAMVMGHGWDQLWHHTTYHPHPPISETLLTLLLADRNLPGTRTPAQNASLLVMRIRASAVIWSLPPLGAPAVNDPRAQIDLALVAQVTWLLSDRASSVPDEEILLNLAMALVVARRADVLDTIDNAERLSAVIADAAAHL